jgi:hypothetical protein
MERLDGLTLDFFRGGSRPCFYLQLHCSAHGDIRAAVDTKPAERHPCPLCGSTCASTAIGNGFTRGTLPAFEVVHTLTQQAQKRNFGSISNGRPPFRHCASPR